MEQVLYVTQQFSKELLAAKGMIKSWSSLSLDIETSGDFKDFANLSITMLQLGTDQQQIVIDARKVDIVPILKMVKDKIVIGHNLKFDLGVIRYIHGIQFSRVFDTMLAAQVLECGDPKGNFTLAEVSRRYVDKYAYSQQTNILLPPVTKEIRKTFATFVGEFTKEQIAYGASDVYYAYRLYIKLSELLERYRLLQTAFFEFQFLHVAIEMELNGVKIDVDGWRKIVNDLSVKSDSLLQELQAHADINWNSPKQVIAVFKKENINTSFFDKKTLELKDSVNYNVISKQRGAHPLLVTYVTYKKTKKLITSYGEKFLSNISADGRIHASVWQILETGRTASRNPNMQQIPRKGGFKDNIIPEKGNVFIIADYANQELRILADKAQEPAMIDAFKHNRDIHLETARIAFGDPTLTKESLERDMAKSMNFLMAYGGGASKLADQFGIPLAQARKLIELYYKTYPKLKEYFQRVGEEAIERGYILIDEIIGRKSYIENYALFKLRDEWTTSELLKYGEVHPIVGDKYRTYKSKIQRDSQNRPIQGTAANISKQAGMYLLQVLKKKPGLFKILLMIHDEYLLECREEDAQQVKGILEDCMLRASRVFCRNLDIPAQAVIKYHWIK